MSTPTVRKWRRRFADAGPAGLLDANGASEPRRPKPGEEMDRESEGQPLSHLWEDVARALREAIVDGDLLAGEQLGETEVAARFKTSRGPVREAIRELSREGLVVENARRTAVVCTPTERDLVEVYGVRRALETLAAENLTERLPAGAIAKLEGHLDQAALTRALAEDWIAVAALDVLENEPPLELDRAPLEMPNVVVTPHVAFYSETAIRTLRESAADNIAKALDGIPPADLVNPEVLLSPALRMSA